MSNQPRSDTELNELLGHSKILDPDNVASQASINQTKKPGGLYKPCCGSLTTQDQRYQHPRALAVDIYYLS